MRKSFYIKALWDEEAKVFYSESNITGLHIEAGSIEDFQKAMEKCAVDMILENHVKPQDLTRKKLTEIIPTIFWERDSSGIMAA